jgi:tetratricopeptide (TPR) repeat protein
MVARRYDEALAQHLSSLELDPLFFKAYMAIGRIYIQKAMYPEAIEMLEKARSLAGDTPHVLGALGQAQGLNGNPGAARAMLAQLAGMEQSRYVPSTTIALVHLGLGEVGRALDYLERACDRHELPVSIFKVHPALDGVRGEPRFAALLKRIGFPD